MTCVWKGLISGLSCYNLLQGKQKECDFASSIKNRNVKTIDVQINENDFTEQELNENFEAIQNLNINDIYNGYMCSTSDPLLALVSQIYKINIIHNFRGTTIKYVYDNGEIEDPDNNKTIAVESDLGHFWFDHKTTKKIIKRLKLDKLDEHEIVDKSNKSQRSKNSKNKSKKPNKSRGKKNKKKH